MNGDTRKTFKTIIEHNRSHVMSQTHRVVALLQSLCIQSFIHSVSNFNTSIWSRVDLINFQLTTIDAVCVDDDDDERPRWLSLYSTKSQINNSQRLPHANMTCTRSLNCCFLLQPLMFCTHNENIYWHNNFRFECMCATCLSFTDLGANNNCLTNISWWWSFSLLGTLVTMPNITEIGCY